MKLSSEIKRGQETQSNVMKELLAREKETLKSKPDKCPDELLRHKKFRHLLWSGV
jgi:hypothetical protein